MKLLPGLRCALVFAVMTSGVAHAADAKPVFLYSRCFNAPGDTRYLPDTTYRQLFQRLERDFEVRVHDRPLDGNTLAGVNVVLIANPGDAAVGTNPPPRHVADRDIESLTAFVRKGGGLIVMGNQENHNLEVVHVNRLLQQFGLQFTNLYTDAKLLPLPAGTPVIGGLRWAYYTGNLVLIETNHAAQPRALVSNDLGIKPPKGDRDQPGVLLAASEPGRGHVLVVTDSGWLTDSAFEDKGIGGVALKGQDNWEIFRRLARWAAQPGAGR